MNLTPQAYLEVYYDQDLFGAVQYQPDALSWTFTSDIAQTGATYQGFTVDPTGQYIIQTPVITALAADPAKWTTSGSGAFGTGTDSASGKAFLRQTNGSTTCTFSALFNTPHLDEQGLGLEIWRGAPITAPGATAPTGAAYAMYISLNSGVDTDDTEFVLAIEAGNPIRLDGITTQTIISNNPDGTVSTSTISTATTLAVASDQGDSETYLTQWNRKLTVSVIPLTDGSYYDDDSTNTSDPPPDTLCVSLNNGDCYLNYASPQLSFGAGSVKITGTGGQWSCKQFGRTYNPNVSFTTSTIARPRSFQSQANVYGRGYIPTNSISDLNCTLTSANSGYATGDISLLDVDGSGNSYQTSILSGVDVEFPAVFLAADPNPTPIATIPVTQFEERHVFDQSTFCLRRSATLTFPAVAPYATPYIIPAVRAGIFYRGLVSDDGTYNDVQVGMTGLIGFHADGIAYFWEDGMLMCRLEMDDLLVRGDGEVAIGFMLPLDGQDIYYSARQIGYRMGFTDDLMNFPYVSRDSDTPNYHLSSGTMQQPLWRFTPDTSPMSALLQIRNEGGAVDFTTGIVTPFYLMTDQFGNLQFYSAPVGLIETWLDTSGAVDTTTVPIDASFSATPLFDEDGTPLLNEFLEGTLECTASLSNIRPLIIGVGLSPADGSIIAGEYYNPELGVTGDPTAPGYIGIDLQLINVSKLYSTQDALTQSLSIQAIQMGFPTQSARFTTWLQSDLSGLDVLALYEPGMLGTESDVIFYSTSVTHRGKIGAGETYAVSDFDSRLLGEAGS